ncbi:myoneurin-like isoform X2 [Armigeres subalbatus]|uniref:myoneurin-like isoform X2 n=1 Tax=Armigeres subalbatus TaxID=124917 RepID=UPI002ED6103F
MNFVSAISALQSNQSKPSPFELEFERFRFDGLTPFSSNLSRKPESNVNSSIELDQCPICYRKFFKGFIFEHHVASHSRENSLPCQLDGKGEPPKTTQIQNSRSISSNESGPLKCHDCGKTFNRVSSLLEHRKTHLPDDSFVCALCGAAFGQKIHLKTHLESVHPKDKPFECSDCRRRFSKMANLVQHRKATHDMKGVQQTIGFRCDICNCGFDKQHSLRMHERKVHGIQRQDDAQQIATIPAIPPIPPSVTTLLIPAIGTSALAVAKSRGEVPFAVLHLMNEIPLIVRVIEQGNCTVLKAAENRDFRESQRGGPGLEEAKSVTIAVVATIRQRIDPHGVMCYEISEPVSNYKANDIPQLEPCNEVLQESLASGDVYKTLTQLNVTEVTTSSGGAAPRSGRLPVCRPREVNSSLPSTSGINKLKRKVTPSKKNAISAPMKRIPPAQPNVVTVVENAAGYGGAPLPFSERNFQDIVTGSLLSPERKAISKSNRPQEVVHVEPDDPFRDIDVVDLIHTGTEMMLSGMDIDIEEPDHGIYIPAL